MLNLTADLLPPFDRNFQFSEPSSGALTIHTEEDFLLYNAKVQPSREKIFMHRSIPLLKRISATVITPFLILSSSFYTLSTIAPHTYSIILISGSTVLTLLACFVACLVIKRFFTSQLSIRQQRDYDTYLVNQVEQYKNAHIMTAWQFATQPTFQHKHPADYANLERTYNSHLIEKVAFYQDQNTLENLGIAIQYAYRITDDAVRSGMLSDLSLIRQVLQTESLKDAYTMTLQIQDSTLHDQCLYHIAWNSFKDYDQYEKQEDRRHILKNVTLFARNFKSEHKSEQFLISVTQFLSMIRAPASSLYFLPNITSLFLRNEQSDQSDQWLNALITHFFTFYDNPTHIFDSESFAGILDTIMLLHNKNQRAMYLKKLADLCREQKTPLLTEAHIASFFMKNSPVDFMALEASLRVEKLLMHLVYQESWHPVLQKIGLTQSCLEMNISHQKDVTSLREKIENDPTTSSEEILVKAHYEKVMQYYLYISNSATPLLYLIRPILEKRESDRFSFALRAYHYHVCKNLVLEPIQE